MDSSMMQKYKENFDISNILRTFAFRCNKRNKINIKKKQNYEQFNIAQSYYQIQIED